jgi:hypothetical protein
MQILYHVYCTYYICTTCQKGISDFFILTSRKAMNYPRINFVSVEENVHSISVEYPKIHLFA